MNEVLFFRLLAQLVVDEGCVLRPYQDSVGKMTIGIGRNLTDNGISLDTAMQMVTEDINEAHAQTKAVFPLLDTYTMNRQMALCNMMFNLGPKNFSGFQATIEAVRSGDWSAAARRALESKWAIQVGDRARRIAALLHDNGD